MRSLLRNLSLGLALIGVFAGCEREDSSKLDDSLSSLRQKAKGDPVEDKDFAARYQAAQARAVQEFPELGVAGSPFNTDFLARVKVLRASETSYFKDPEWPYKLAVELSVKNAPQRRVVPGSGGGAAPVAAPDNISTSVPSLQIMRSPATYAGRWVPVTGTLVSARGLNPEGIITLELEGGLKCEVVGGQIYQLKGVDVSGGETRVESKNNRLVFTIRAPRSSAREVFVLEPGISMVLKGELVENQGRWLLRSALVQSMGR